LAKIIKSYSKLAITKLVVPLAALALVVTACQDTSTGTPQVGKPTPTLAETPEVTKTDAPRTPASPTLQATAESTIGLSPGELQDVEVSLWHVWPGTLGAVFDQLVADFNASNEYGAQVNATYQGNYNELYEKVAAALSNGELPDIAVGYNYTLTAWNERSEPLVDLNTYINDPNWGLSEQEQSDFYSVFLDQDEVDGFRVGIPAQRFGLLMYYNATWAQELGFENPPQSPRQFRQQACAASQAKRSNDDLEDDGTGGWVVNASPSGVLSWMYAFGSEVVNSRGTGYQLDTSQTEAALSFLKELHDNGCAWEINAEFAGEEFAGRQALLITASIADLPVQSAAFADSDNADEWIVMPFPSPAGEPVVDVYGPAFTIFRASEAEQLAAWTFLRWFLSPEVQARWVSAGHTLPIRATTIDHLDEFTADHPQWTQALEFLPLAKSEPDLGSWSVVRWVLSDVGTQMFRPYFTADRIPDTAELLDETADELHERFEP
jgi:multiple sugar transport system substrate-binding protein